MWDLDVCVCVSQLQMKSPQGKNASEDDSGWGAGRWLDHLQMIQLQVKEITQFSADWLKVLSKFSQQESWLGIFD